MSLVRGQNVVVLIFDGGVWKHYACGRSCTFNISTEFIETSVAGHGKTSTFAPTKNSFTGSIDGLMDLNPSGKLSFPDLQQRQLAHQILLMRWQRTDESGNVYTSEANFYISNSTDEGSFDNANIFSIELKGTGTPIQVFTPTATLNSSKVKREPLTGVGGENTITKPALIGKDILEVVKDGLGYAKIILTGTPIGKEVKYTSSTGSFEFAQQWEPGEEGYVLYQDI